MKRWLIVAILVAALVAVVAGTALAQGTAPATPPATGTCPCGLTPATGVRGPMMGGGMMGGMRGGMPEWAGMSESVETLLGMTAAEIQAERQAGKSLVQIAASKNVTEEALIQTILDEHSADLAELVAAGKLTQAQADAMIARMQEQVKVMVERAGVGPMMGQGQGQQNVPPAGLRGGRGGMRGGMFGGVQG